MRILFSLEFNKWLLQQTDKAKCQIEYRIDRIRFDNYFGDYKLIDLEHNISELRWRNGRRVYFALLPEESLILLLGGNKNGQKKDIQKAKNIFKKAK